MNLPYYASKACARVAQETLDPRELEASLLLKAAARLQSVLDGWNRTPARTCRHVAVQPASLDRVH